MFRITTILYATDFSPLSKQAFQVACSLAHDHGARLIALHVIELPAAVPPEQMNPPPPGGIQQIFEDQLHQLRPPVPGVTCNYELVEGDPATEILRVAQARNCDLIVMGCHGRSGIARLLMGSVAEQVMRKASGLVLIVKGPAAEAAA